MGADDAEEVTPREAFSLLGHEIRLEILLALLDRWVAAHTEPRTYAALMDAVDMRDSGKFNYHLERLRGTYVRKVDGGYVPTASATALYRAVLAHRPGEPIDRTRFAVDSACPRCGADPIASYERGFLSVDCESCGDWAGFTYPFPANGLEGRSGDEVVRAAHRRSRHHVALARAGQCPFCAGTTTVEVRTDVLEDEDEHGVEISCDTCTFFVGLGILAPLLLDARAAAALSDAGVDIERYGWELPEPTTRVESREPLRVALDVCGPEGTATIVVDGDLEVQSVAVGRR